MTTPHMVDDQILTLEDEEDSDSDLEEFKNNGNQKQNIKRRQMMQE